MASPYYSDTPFQNAYGFFDQARQFAMPSPQSLDQASARVRSRVSNEGMANTNKINEQYVGSGLGVSGMHQAALGQNRAAQQSALGTGLADVQEDYWNKQQSGAKVLGDLGTGYGNVAGKQAELGLTEGLKGRELGIEEDKLEEQKRAEIARLTEQRRQDMARNLMDYFVAMGQYGNVQSYDPSTVAQIKERLFQQVLPYQG